MDEKLKKRIAIVIIILMILIIGSYISGLLMIFMLKIWGKAPLGLFTYWQYVIKLADPRLAPFMKQILMAGLAGFGLVSSMFGLIVYAIKHADPKSLHGDARFAHSGDIGKANMYKATDTSLVVGKFKGRLLHYSGQQFAILAAPTRSGKGVGIVIPNLLSYEGSAVVLDIKQENFDLTSGYRSRELKQEIYLFNPFAEDGRTHRWNPLTYVSKDPNFMISDLSSIAAMLYPDAGADQKFWVAQARNAFLAFSLYVIERQNMQQLVLTVPQENATNEVTPATLGEIYRLSTGDGSDLKKHILKLAEAEFITESTKTAFAGLTSQAEETFSSIMGTFKEPLNPWINPIVDAATSADDFLLTDVRKRKMTIYIGILPNKLAESRLIVNLFFSQLININTKELPQNNPELKHQCLLLMDEFTSIGKVDIIATAVSYMAGYNIRLLPIIQSMAQLDAVYGKEMARTLITNHALQIVYAPREQSDAQDYSEMLGYTTVKKESISRGREVSRSENEERRALMLPQEIKAMGPDSEVILFEGIPCPIKCDKIRYYQDKMFTSRLLEKFEVPPLV